MLRPVFRVEQRLGAQMEAEIAFAEQAVTGAVLGASQDVQAHLRQVTQAAFQRGRGVANAWQVKQYPRDSKRTAARASLNASALIYTRAPLIIEAAAHGPTIVPLGGRRYLALPTPYNLPSGRRRPVAEARGLKGVRVLQVRVTPRQMVASRMAFTRPLPGGGLTWFLRVVEAQSKGKSARPIRQAIAGGIGGQGWSLRVGTGRGRNRTARAVNLIEADAVPMFWLIPQAKMKKVLDLEPARSLGAASLAYRLVQALTSGHAA